MNTSDLINAFHSEIDSLRFGIKVAKINDGNSLTAEVLTALQSDNFDLVISRVNASDIQLINKIEELGFRIKDVQLTYMFDFSKSEIRYGHFNSKLLIREAEIHDLDSLVQISDRAFMNYGHYFANERLDKNDCIEVYRDWTKNTLGQMGAQDKFWVAEADGKVAGFLAFKAFQKDGCKYSAGVVGAVDTYSRGANVFSSLTIKGLEWGQQNGHEWQEHNVLNINYAVNRVFSKLGFYIYKSEITLHCWLK